MGSATLGSLLAVAFAPADANVVQGVIDLFHNHVLTPAAYASIGLSAALSRLPPCCWRRKTRGPTPSKGTDP